MYGKHRDEGYEEILPGIRIKTVCAGNRTLMSEFRMEAGARLPAHSHLNEQTGYLVKGRIRLGVGDQCREIAPGDSWCVPAGWPHTAEIMEDSVAIEVFSPPREDYLKYLRAGDVEE